MYLWFFKERNYKIVLSLFCVLIIVVFIANGGGVYIEGAAPAPAPAAPAPAAPVTVAPAAPARAAPAPVTGGAAPAPEIVQITRPTVDANVNMISSSGVGVGQSGPNMVREVVNFGPPGRNIASVPLPPNIIAMRNNMTEIQSINQQNPNINNIHMYIQKGILPIIFQNANINFDELNGNIKMQAIKNDLNIISTDYLLKCMKYVNDSMNTKTYKLDEKYNTNITSCINNVNKFITDNNISPLLLNMETIYFNLFNNKRTDLNNSIVSQFVNKYRDDNNYFGGEGNATIIIKGIFNLLFQMINEITAL